MKLKEIFIENFRGIKKLHLKLDYPTTILIGENNTGKTTILEALKIVLNRSRIYKENTFSEYDFHSEENCNPFDNEILIELWFKEEIEDEWSEEIKTVLADFTQLDPMTNLYSIGIRVKSRYDADEKLSKESWHWLGLMNRNEVDEIRGNNYTYFFKITQYFYQNALRDAKSSFSQRSMFWNKFLKLNLNSTQIRDFTNELQDINDRILASDTKVNALKTELDKISEVVTNDIDNVAIQAFPEKVWDLSDKATLVIRTLGSSIQLPLERFGQGTQSLSVLMLFKAYSEILMQANTDENAIAILGLEEPEVHLYPQAVRSLWTFLEKIEQQKIVSTHSTFFIQEADLTSLRLLKRKNNIVQTFSIQQTFETRLPKHDDLITLCNANENLSFKSFPTTDGSQEIGTLTVNGKLKSTHYQELTRIYNGDIPCKTKVDDLNERSKMFLTEDELFDLKYYTERIRGEIFFAKAWLLCEGQSEYLLLRYFAQLMGKDFDKNGVSVIDYKNNGSAGLFISLAKHFDMPWLLFSDNDQAYQNTINELNGREINPSDIDNYVNTYPTENTDFELFLYQNGFKDDYFDILIPDNTLHPRQPYRIVKKIDIRSNAVLTLLADGATTFIAVKISENLIFRFESNERGYSNLLPLIMRNLEINNEELENRKLNTTFSVGQSKIDLLHAKIADVNIQIVYNNTGKYHLNFNVLGKQDRIDDTHLDYEILMQEVIVTQIRKNKILHVQKLIRNLRKAGATDAKVPPFFKDLINNITSMI